MTSLGLKGVPCLSGARPNTYRMNGFTRKCNESRSVGRFYSIISELIMDCLRYLNQRFIEDIDDLSKEQGNITKINISSKFEQLEEKIAQLSSQSATLNLSLETLREENVALTSSNSNLEQELNNLESKYFTVESNSLAVQEKIKALEKNEKTLYEEIEKLKACEQKAKDERKVYEEKTELAFTAREAEFKRVLTAVQQSEEEMKIKIQQLGKTLDKILHF